MVVIKIVNLNLNHIVNVEGANADKYLSSIYISRFSTDASNNFMRDGSSAPLVINIFYWANRHCKAKLIFATQYMSLIYFISDKIAILTIKPKVLVILNVKFTAVAL